MAHFRETPCKYYVCKGTCKKGENAEQTELCQTCSKYVPRAKVRHINKKKEYVRNPKN